MSEKEWLDIFRANLKDMLKEAGMTAYELEIEAGLSHGTVYRYLNGNRMPTVRAIANMYDVLSNIIDCSIMDFIYFGEQIN